jgi:NAD(P)-dependent dehydrogenase (short-subunit alcohol dehydrogenase family)
MAGEVVLITGATDGLGAALAAELVGAGAKVLIHGRDRERIDRTASEVGDGAAGSYRADFASLEEVGAMAERVLAERDRLDVLVNNAGIGTTLPGEGRRLESDDGYELRFAVNYLAGFLLTGLLESLLVASAPSRIVNVSSAGQMAIDFDDVMLERGYSGTRAYCQSKLAQVMHTIDLAERLGDRRVTANCLHPATYMPTKIVFAARGSAVSSLEEGVQATARLVSDPSLDEITGRYFDGLHEAGAEAQAYDREARRRLRELSERLIEGAIGRPGSTKG